MNIRVGNGIDVHALVIGWSLVPGGVAIPFNEGIASLATVPLIKDR